MSSIEDAKLLKQLKKQELKKLDRMKRIQNGTATTHDRRLYKKERDAMKRRLAEQEAENVAKRSRSRSNGSGSADEMYARLEEARQQMDEDADEFGMWVDDDTQDHPAPVERVERVHNRNFNPKKQRKQFWAEGSEALLTAFIESFKRCGEPDFRLEKPLEVEKPASCNCSIRRTSDLTGFMFGGPSKFSVSYCDHQSLLETLVLCQMLPTSTQQPKSAIHFSVFEYGNIAKLDGYVSNHGFTKIYNSWCLQRGGFSKDFIPMDASVYNMLQAIYRNVHKHAMDRLREENSLDLQVGCYACHGAERKFVSVDGNFSWRRRKDRNSSKNNWEQGIFAPSRAEIALVAPPEEVERFNDHTEVTDEEAGVDHRRQNGNRFDECGVFSLNCARHGIVERIFDIFGGEGRKYALAAISHVVDNLGDQEKLAVLYDIVCMCQKRIEESVPLINRHDLIYGVAIFHALAHSLNCQVKYFPRYVKGMALTDGESVERVWSHCNHFVSMSRNMSKANRHALLTQVLDKYRSDKIDSLASYINRKYKKVLTKMRLLNMSIAEYKNLEQEWLKHADNLCIFPDFSGLEQIQNSAERVEALRNAKVHYLILVAQHMTLINKETKSKFTGYHVEHLRKTLLVKIQLMERQFEFLPVNRPKNFKDPLFGEYHVQVKDCRYDALNNYLTHLLFAIVMREKKLHQPAGSSGTAKAARIVISLEALHRLTEKVISRINTLVLKYFDGAEDKMTMTVGREVEKLRTSAQGENILGLSDALANWHLLNRHVEEATLLIEESNRFVSNLTKEYDEMERALRSQESHLLRRQFLQTCRRLYVAKKTLQQVRNQVQPTISLTPTPDGSTNDLVVIEYQQFELLNEGDAVAEEDSEDDDFAEGGDDEEDLQEVLREIGDASLGR
ncbi:phenylalanyl-tRNA synthetase alpha subunit, mitochondrial [Mucor velutinosus]|uniref:Phenylalanyl-tRNA synthetase alpha subunit, mitochondrial n=1 Tax=Mucor velutinosus TaxID=708070 RepID=A0AAN7DLG6_9FUNG|nr:phenylalanyl-tRNA synthetase alpha subunit, mitochondrial [Mucor velutinosus]